MNCVHFSVSQDIQSISTKLFCVRLTFSCIAKRIYSISDVALHTCLGTNFVGFPSVHFFRLLLSKTATTVLQWVNYPSPVWFSVRKSVGCAVCPIAKVINKDSRHSWYRYHSLRDASSAFCKLRFVCWSQRVGPTGTLVPLFFWSLLWICLSSRDCVKDLAQYKICNIQCPPTIQNTVDHACYVSNTTAVVFQPLKESGAYSCTFSWIYHQFYTSSSQQDLSNALRNLCCIYDKQ